MDYPVKLKRDDNDTILVSFPDFRKRTPTVMTKATRSSGQKMPWRR